MNPDLLPPPLLTMLLAAGTLTRRRGSWPLLQGQDYYGNPLETELGLVFQTEDERRGQTLDLPRQFRADGDYGQNPVASLARGMIEDIKDFDQILWFAIAGDGSPFCLDYRDNPQEPSVIWWDDTCWRRLAPSFRDFCVLFGFVTE